MSDDKLEVISAKWEDRGKWGACVENKLTGEEIGWLISELEQSRTEVEKLKKQNLANA